MSFSRNEITAEDEFPRHHHPKTREYSIENDAISNGIEDALLRASRGRKGEVEKEEKGGMKRGNEKEMTWQSLQRSQRALKLEKEREKEMLLRELLSDMTHDRMLALSKVKRTASKSTAATNTFGNRPLKHAKTAQRQAGKHREREKEIEKERNDHHGRTQRIRIHEQERERKKHRMINGELVNELEKEMRGRRQRMTKQGGKIREEEERFRARERSRQV